jgi:hypothetical protein
MDHDISATIEAHMTLLLGVKEYIITASCLCRYALPIFDKLIPLMSEQKTKKQRREDKES